VGGHRDANPLIDLYNVGADNGCKQDRSTYGGDAKPWTIIGVN